MKNWPIIVLILISIALGVTSLYLFNDLADYILNLMRHNTTFTHSKLRELFDLFIYRLPLILVEVSILLIAISNLFKKNKVNKEKELKEISNN